MDNTNNLRRIFHKTIIAIFLLSIVGCGVKKAPFYEKKAPKSDANIEFKLK